MPLIDDLIAEELAGPSSGNAIDRLIAEETGASRPDPIQALIDDELAQPGLGRRALAFGARTIPPVAGFFAGGPVGGAVGGAVGEIIAQQIESPGEFRPLPVAGEAALGAVPFGRAAAPLARAAGRLVPGRAAQALATGLEAGAFGAGATGVQTLTREGRLPTPGEVALGAGTGAVLGGALGAARFRPEAPATPRPIQPEAPSEEVAEAVQRDIAIRQQAREARGMTEVLAASEIRDLAQAARELPTEAFADLPSLVASLRGNRVLSDLVSRGRVRDLTTPEGANDLAEIVSLTASQEGMGLRELRGLIEATQGLLGGQAQQAQRNGFLDIANRLNNTRRALMVQMLGTQVRNAISGGLRIGLTGAARLVTGAFDPVARQTGAELLRSAVRPRQAVGQTRAILEALPEIKRNLLRFGAGEVETDNAVIKAARFLNLGLSRIAEKGPRVVSFHAFTQEAMTRRGLDYDSFAAAPQAFLKGLDDAGRLALDEALGEAVTNSRAITFSEDTSGAIGQTFTRLINATPLSQLLLTQEFPFPRFLASAANFLINFSPLGLARLFAPRIAQDPTRTGQQLGELAVGTGLLATALALRGNPETRGEKFYEVRLPGVAQPLDLRPFAPILAPHLFMAEALFRLDEGQSLQGMETRELTEGLLGLNRIEGVATLGLSSIGAGGRQTIEGATEGVQQLLGNFLGSLTVPLRQLKDIFGDDRSVDRKANDLLRVFGPTLGNIPFAAEFLDLPQTIKPTTGRPFSERAAVNVFGLRIPAGVLRQLGVSTVEKDRVERVLNELGIDAFEIGARTGLAGESPLRPEARPAARALDQRINQIMGPAIVATVARWIDTPGFKRIRETDPDSARFILRDVLKDIRETARVQAEAELLIRSPQTATTIMAARPTASLGALGRRRALERDLSTRFGRQPAGLLP